MKSIRFLLDENVTPKLRTILIQREPGMIVWKVGDPGAPQRSSSDPDILNWCEKNSFILVTYNRISMPIHVRNHLKNGNHFPGILILNPAMSLGEIVNELLLIWGASESDEYRDMMLYLPIT